MQDSPTSDKGKQVDQGQREKKDECGLIKEGSPSQAEYTNSSLRKDVSLKKGLSRCDDIIEAEPLSQMQPPRGTSPVTHGKGVFSEHRNPFHNALQMNGYSQQFYIPFPVLTGFPVPGESGYFRFSGMLPAMFEDRTKQSQVMGGEMPSKDEEEFSGKGDPAGGQSEQKQGQDPIDDSTGTGGVFHFGHSNKKKSPASDKIDLGKSKSERSSTKNTLLNQELNASVHPAPPIPNYIHGSQSTCGIFPFFDQGQPPDFYEPLGKSQTPVNPQFINASYFTSLDMQTVWGAVPLAQCGPIPPLYAYNPGIQASFSHRSSVTDEVTTAKVVSSETKSSKGRGRSGRGIGPVHGGRGRGRGRRKECQGVINPIQDNQSSKTLNEKSAGLQGEKQLSKGEATENQEITCPTFSRNGLINKAHLTFSETIGLHVLSNKEGCHNDPQASGVKANNTTTGTDSSSSYRLLCTREMTQMTSQGDEQGNWTVHDVPPLSQCSPGGTTLEQGEADFFIAGPSGPIRDQASRHLRKKAKSQKIIESENLWHKLTDGPKVGICTDPLMKVNGHISQGYQAEFAAHGHLTPGTTVKVGHPPLSKDDGFSDAYLTGMEIKRNPQSSMKSGRRHGLKACARLQHLAIQGQGNNSGCLGQSSGADMLTASEGSRHSMLPSGVASVHAGDEFMDFKSIEVVEDWQSYCPYLPFSAYLIHVYEDGKPREISLPIFGSSRVSPSTDKTCPDYYDLVLNAGGSIWALDWCPHRTLTADLGVEFLAVGAHPHDSPTHRLGEVVLGKGLIQIWAFDLPQLTHAQTKWHYNLSNAQSRGNRKGRNPPKGPTQLRRLTPEDEESSMLLTGAESAAHEKPPLQLEGGKPDEQVDIECEKAEIAESVLASHVEISDLPKMVLGLAHDGGVVWDAKWQPISTTSIRRAGHLGNLAAVYGDGSIEVYDVPMPSMVRKLKFFSESSAPLIVKMKPAFKCSGIISCGQKSLPLTVEWSSSSPHNLLLVGCHDGAVALWKFTPQGSSCLDVKPLACFVADSAPVRALAFAPHGSDPESRNIFVTGGHSGRLLFWDFRDPFHPLWELSLSKGGCIFSIDWLLYPRGIVLSLDDGTIRTVSLDVALSDPSLTGTPPAKTPSQGVHSTFTSDYSVWSVHVSRASCIAVYAGEDGSIVHCQLSERYFANDRARAREPHFVCCKLAESRPCVLSFESVKSDAPLQVKNQRTDSKQVPLTKSFSKRVSCSIYEQVGHPTKKLQHISAKRKVCVLEGIEIEDDEFFPEEEENPLALVPYDPGKNTTPKAKSRSFSTKSKYGKHGVLNASSASDPGLSSNTSEPAEKPPSKAVAVHRVRWNQNKGSESLICFGGAAGIIRCQVIMPRGL